MRLIDADALNIDELCRLRSDLKSGLVVGSTLRYQSQIDKYIKALDKIIDRAPTVFSCNACKNMRNERECIDCHNYSNYVHYEERLHGEWIDEGQYAEGYSEHAYACKKCGYHIIENPNMIYENRFCKYCGADMRGEEE